MHCSSLDYSRQIEHSSPRLPPKLPGTTQFLVHQIVWSYLDRCGFKQLANKVATQFNNVVQGQRVKRPWTWIVIHSKLIDDYVHMFSTKYDSTPMIRSINNCSHSPESKMSRFSSSPVRGSVLRSSHRWRRDKSRGYRMVRSWVYESSCTDQWSVMVPDVFYLSVQNNRSEKGQKLRRWVSKLSQNLMLPIQTDEGKKFFSTFKTLGNMSASLYRLICNSPLWTCWNDKAPSRMRRSCDFCGRDNIGTA